MGEDRSGRIWRGGEYDQTIMDIILKELIRISKKNFQTSCLIPQGHRVHCPCRYCSIHTSPPLTSEQELMCLGTHGKHRPCSCWVIKERFIKKLSWGTPKRGGTVPQVSHKELSSDLNLKDLVRGWVTRPQMESVHEECLTRALAFNGGVSLNYNDQEGGSQNNTRLF